MAQITNEYSDALFALAKENDAEQEYVSALDTVVELMRENPEYMDFLASPNISKEERTESITKVFSDSMPEYIVNFLCVLCENSRIRNLEKCVNEFKELCDFSAHISKAEVVSAVELNEKQKSALKAKLEKLCGHTVILECSVDETLIGGMTVLVDEKIIDGSIKHKLHELKGVMYR